MDTPASGDRYLSPSGRIWTVARTTRRGDRIALRTDGADGCHGAVVDLAALARMIPLDRSPAEPLGPSPSGEQPDVAAAPQPTGERLTAGS
jgi:hypothetical protein